MLEKIIIWLTNFIRIQLFLTLISWPFLLVWGLPLSLLSFVGNLVFTPFLCGFLFISSLIFLTELFSVPNSTLIIMLEHITNSWLFVTSWGSSRFLLSFATPPPWILLCVPVTTLVILHHRKLHKNSISIAYFLLFFILMGSFLTLFPPKKPIITLLSPYKTSPILINYNKQLILLDPGTRKKSSGSWVDYTLVPTLIKNYGKQSVDLVIIVNLSKVSGELVQQLCRKKLTKKIVVPDTKNYSLEELMVLAQKNSIEFIAFEKNFTVNFSGKNYIKLTQENNCYTAHIKIEDQELVIDASK